jgi:hypothetical protein
VAIRRDIAFREAKEGTGMTNDDDITEAADAAVLAFATTLPPVQREYADEVAQNIAAELIRIRFEMTEIRRSLNRIAAKA